MSSSEEPLPELEGIVTISLAAEMLGVSRQTAHQMAADRRLAAWRIPSAGRDWPVVVKRRDVEMMMPRVQPVVDLSRIPEGAVVDLSRGTTRLR